jgi:hypothetical protein
MTTTEEHDDQAQSAPGPLDFPRALRAQIVEWAADYVTTQDRIDIMRASEKVLGPLWFKTVPRRRWFDRADDLIDFIAEHQRFPRSGAESQAEQTVIAWLYVQIGKGDALPLERRRYLDSVMPGWDEGFAPRLPRSTDLAPAIAEFIAENGRWPIPRADDEHERQLGGWLNARRTDGRAARVNGFVAGRFYTPEFAAYLDETIPGWLGDGRTRDQVWQDTAEEVTAFVAEHDRWPDTQRDRPEEHPKRHWLMYQRSAARGVAAIGLSPERRAYLDEKLPGWDAGTLWTGSVKDVLERDGGVPDLSLRAHLARLAEAEAEAEAEQPSE